MYNLSWREVLTLLSRSICASGSGQLLDLLPDHLVAKALVQPQQIRYFTMAHNEPGRSMTSQRSRMTSVGEFAVRGASVTTSRAREAASCRSEASCTPAWTQVCFSSWTRSGRLDKKHKKNRKCFRICLDGHQRPRNGRVARVQSVYDRRSQLFLAHRRESLRYEPDVPVSQENRQLQAFLPNLCRSLQQSLLRSAMALQLVTHMTSSAASGTSLTTIQHWQKQTMKMVVRNNLFLSQNRQSLLVPLQGNFVQTGGYHDVVSV